VKRFGVGFLSVLAFLILSYAGWVSYPPSRYEAWASQIVERATREFEVTQKAARDPKQNGYLAPHLVAFWGRKGMEYRDGAPPTAVVEAASQWSDLSKGEPTGLESHYREAGVQQVFSDLQEVLVPMHEAFQKPYFVAPERHPLSWETVFPNLLPIRKTFLATAGYSHFLLASGRVDAAIQAQLPALHFTKALSQPPRALIATMLSVACGDISRHSLAMLLSRAGDRVSTAVLLDLSKTLEATQMPADQLMLSLEDEFFAMLNSAQAVRQNGYVQMEPLVRIALSLAPGLAERELRLIKNEYLESLHHFKNDSETDYLNFMTNSQSQATATGWFSGQSSPVTDMALTNFSSASHSFRLARARQAYLHLWVGLILQQRQHQRWPASLEEMQKLGYQPLDGLDLSRVTLSQFELGYVPPEPEAQKLKVNSPTPGMERWNLLNVPEWKALIHNPRRPRSTSSQ